MIRNAGFAAALAIAYLAIAGAAQAYDDKPLQPPAGPPRSLKDEGGGGFAEGYPPPQGYPLPPRPAGIQIFVGTPHEYNGYRPYYGPYMYGSPSRSGASVYVGPDHGDGGACRRWAWVHLAPGKWLWGIIDQPNGEWRCAEW
jgi:hypothetical protein